MHPQFLSTTCLSLLVLAFTIMPAAADQRPAAPIVIETPGMAPVQVFVGGALSAQQQADAHQKVLAVARAAEAAARALAEAERVRTIEPVVAVPDYPALAPVILAAPLVPVPAYPQAPPIIDGLPAAAAAPLVEPKPVQAASAGVADMRPELAAAMKVILDKPEAYGHARLTRAQRDEIAAVYASRGYAAFWSDGRGLTDKGGRVYKHLQSAAHDGLDASAYGLPPLPGVADMAARAAYDFRLTQAVVLYARDAQGGRIDARRLSNLIDPENELAAPADIVAAVIDAADPAVRLAAYNPPHAGYKALRAHLILLRTAADATGSTPVTAAVDVKPDEGLAARRRKTAALAAASSKAEADIIANMERWRWLPRDLGEKHVFVNIPEYRVRVMDRGAVAHDARVIVGKPDSPTPVFSDRMQFLVVNPSWFVPPSIMKKEFLPRLAEDPTYAERRGYQVIRRGKTIYVKQPPGERNALGNIKFMFPNRHAVYLHDTPSRGLFGADRRAFSHGCVRVDQPFRLAEHVLGKDNGWSEQRVRGLVGRGEQSVKLSQPLPVHLAYFTQSVDDMGRLQAHDDIYGHNRRVKAALGLE